MYSMRDPRWAALRMGNSRYPIGVRGSLLCCLADVILDTRQTCNPASLNRWLAQQGGYTHHGDIVLSALESWGISERSTQADGALDSSFAAIRMALRMHLTVLVCVWRDPWRARDLHWLRVLMLADGDLSVHDPWQLPGDQYPVTLMPLYARPDQSMDDAVRAVRYLRSVQELTR